MKNIIEELWNGEINPQDTLVDNNPHYFETISFSAARYKRKEMRIACLFSFAFEAALNSSPLRGTRRSWVSRSKRSDEASDH